MSTAGQTLEKDSNQAVSPPIVTGWFRRLLNKCLDAMGLRAPLGYEDETGFHYGSIPRAEQERMALKNMAGGEEQCAADPPSERK